MLPWGDEFHRLVDNGGWVERMAWECGEGERGHRGPTPWIPSATQPFHPLFQYPRQKHTAPGGQWSISTLEAIAAAKQADFEAAIAAGTVPWFLTAWFEATAAGRAADAACAVASVVAEGKRAVVGDAAGAAAVHPVHPPPCLRVFTSLVRA
jgi:hypothetical protein